MVKVSAFAYLKHKFFSVYRKEKDYKRINLCVKPSMEHAVVVTVLFSLQDLFINKVRLDNL